MLPLRVFAALILIPSTLALPTIAAAAVSPAWQAARRQLSECLGVDAAELRGVCLERAAKALDEAEARGEGLIPSPQAVRETQRRDYGDRRPTPRVEVGEPVGRERPDRLSTTLASAHMNAQGAWVLRTVEGAVWAQTDGGPVAQPPHAGSSLVVRPGALGSYFCLLDGRREVRCKRRS